MPHLIAIEGSESQRRQLKEKIIELNQKGFPLNGRFEANNENKSFSSWQSIFENAVTPGLFAARETIVIENADSLGTFPEELLSLVENENANCVLILIFNSDSKNLKIIDKNLIEIIKPEPSIPPWKKKSWLMDLAKNQKFKLATDAAQLLADSIESQEELRSEISKLALFASGREIKLSDVENLSFDEGSKAQLTFLDGVCDNKISDVVKSLVYLRQEPLLPVLTAISNRLRPALITSCFSKSVLDSALKASGTDPSQKKYAINKANSALKNYGENAIKKFMLKAAEISFFEKTNNSKSWQGFELAILELVLKIR